MAMPTSSNSPTTRQTANPNPPDSPYAGNNPTLPGIPLPHIVSAGVHAPGLPQHGGQLPMSPPHTGADITLQARSPQYRERSLGWEGHAGSPLRSSPTDTANEDESVESSDEDDEDKGIVARVDDDDDDDTVINDGDDEDEGESDSDDAVRKRARTEPTAISAALSIFTPGKAVGVAKPVPVAPVVRNYVPSNVTPQRVEGSFARYWQEWEGQATATTTTSTAATTTTTTTSSTAISQTSRTTTTSTDGFTTTTSTSPAATSPTASLRATRSGDNPPQSLQSVFDAFLDEPGAGTLLLLGEGGLGKSLSIHVLATRLKQAWWQFFADPLRYPKPDWLPISVRSHVKNWSDAKLENACVKIIKRHGLDLKQTRLLVFVDGYDECQAGSEFTGNLADILGLPTNAKLIATCRPDTVAEDELEACFANQGKLNIFHFLPFNSCQLLAYLNEHLEWDDATHARYQSRLQISTESLSVLRNPFVAYLLWQSWETVRKTSLEDLSRADIDTGFIEHMVNAGRSALPEKVQQKLQADHADLAQSFAAYAREIAYMALQKQRMKPLLAKAGQAGSVWTRLDTWIVDDAHRRYQERERQVLSLNDASRKEQKRRMVLTEDDFVRMRQQESSKLSAGLLRACVRKQRNTS